MKQFKTLIILKQPRELVWSTMRDELPSLVPLVNDIESITTESREKTPDGRVRLVNVWTARPIIPSVLKGVLNPNMLRWTDRADYDPEAWQCHWRIEPHFYPDRTHCEGVTHYESAMGGAGTRVKLEGWLEVNARGLPGVPSFLEPTVASAIEGFITALIPGNFQKLANALGSRLESATR